MYKTISRKEGQKFFPSIATIFVSEGEKLWANPFENRDLRHRCLFIFMNNERKDMEVYFHLTEEETNILPSNIQLPKEIYFYGAYNQINVCQMRGYGTLREVTDKNENEMFQSGIREWLEKNVAIGSTKEMHQPDAMEKRKALEKLKSGKVFHFKPESFAYHMYERG